MNKVTEKYEENSKRGEIIEVYCNKCFCLTRHCIVSSNDYLGTETFEGWDHKLEWSSSHQIIQCQGCMTSSFRQVDWYSPEFCCTRTDEFVNGERVIIFPERLSDKWLLRNFNDVPINLNMIYRESVECFNNKSYVLAAAGLRALIEGLCKTLDINDGLLANGKRSKNLAGKIAGLHEKGHLTKTHADILHQHRYMGNDAVHELSQPIREELGLAIEIIEHTFEAIFEIPPKGDELKEKIKQRANRC